MRSRTALATVLLLVTVASGCTSWRTMRVPADQLVEEFQPGALRVRRANGTRVELEQPVVRNDSIVESATGLGVRLGDAQAIEIRRFSPIRTLLLPVAGLGGLMLLYMIPAAACHC